MNGNARRYVILASLLCLLCLTNAAEGFDRWRVADASPLADSGQCLVVLANGWNDLHATLQRFERDANGWHAVGLAVPCVLGRHGLAWGRGLGAPAFEGGAAKREGDLRSPAGLFRIERVFGFASPAEAKRQVRMPYVQLTAPLDCVDDVASPHYNQLVDRSKVTPDWRSAEHMRKVREYQWGAFVGHNVDPVKPGAGSCIFLHIWDGPDHGTAGCTAMDAASLEALLFWLRPERHPVLIQMPRRDYARLRDSWNLPRTVGSSSLLLSQTPHEKNRAFPPHI